VGSRATAGKPEKTGVPGGSSSPIHFSAGGDTHRHLHKKKKHKPVDFTSSFLQICFWFHFSSPPETILLRRRALCFGSSVNEGYSTVADLAARRCDDREGVALLGPEQLVSPLCSGCRWRLLGLRAPPC
jgi:hypothetical protein